MITESSGSEHILDADLFYPRLRTYYIGRKIETRSAVDSTQDVVRQRAGAGEAEGFVLVADTQTGGRGRKGDRWFSPSGSGLYLSLLLRPRFPAIMPLPLALGLAAAQAVEAVSDVRAELKWPNDLTVDDRKLGGILAESQVQDGVVLYVVAGIGINVHEPAGGWPPELARTAACIGMGATREGLLAELLNAIEANYELLRAGDVEAVLTEYRRRCPYRGGAPVTFVGADGRPEEARAIEIESDGALLVELPGGAEQRLYGHQVIGLRRTALGFVTD